MTLTVSPSQDSAVSEKSIASGISMRMMTVERQLPRKDQDHEADQSSCKRRFTDNANYGRFDKNRLIADGMKIEARRQALFDPRQQRFDAVDDVQRRRSTGL